MHSKKKGKSGSKRPSSKIVPNWVEFAPNEVEELVAKFAKEGMTAAGIGLILRDRYGIPSVKNLCGKSVTEMMKDSGMRMDYPEDLMNLIKRATRIRKHLIDNKQDKHNKTSLSRQEAKIKRLVLYYREKGKLPKDWSYDPEKAALLVK